MANNCGNCGHPVDPFHKPDCVICGCPRKDGGTMIKKVEIDRENCLNHECCQDICPEVFVVPQNGEPAMVREGAQVHFVTKEREIRRAVATCPMGAIKTEESP